MKIGMQTWGSDGDIRPFLALAGAMRARGHDVSLVVTSVDNKDYTTYGRDLDIKLSSVGRLSLDDAALRVFNERMLKSRTPIDQLETVIKYFFDPVVPEMHEASKQLCRDCDVLVGHTIHFPAHTAAESAGIPYATVMLNHAGIYSRHATITGVPDLGRWMNPYWWKLLHFVMDRLFGPRVNALRTAEGLAPVRNIIDTVWASPKLNLLALSPVICDRKPDWPDFHHVCGFFAVPERAEQWTMPGDLKQFLDAGPAPVYMTVGSMISLDISPKQITDLMMKAALLAGCRAIIQSRWDELTDLPDHRNIYKIRKAPHRHIFPHCRAVVHHGGSGTSHSATLHGCPSIIIQHGLDQAVFARELHRLGAAVKGLDRKTVTVEKLASAMRAVLDAPTFKTRAEELGAIMKAERGLDRAGELIEERLPGGTA